MIERDPEHPVSRALEELGTVDPPARLVENVMMGISANSGNRSAGRAVPFDRGGIAMIRKAMWGLAAAAAVVLVIYTVIGFPIANRGTEATIGAAQKYQTPQLAAGDVKVGDASVQEFLQSEAFDRLIKDPQARSILTDSRIHAQLTNKDFTNSIANAQTRQQLSSDNLHQFFGDSAAVAGLNLGIANGFSADAALARLAKDAALSVSTRGVVNQVRVDAALVRMLDDNALLKAFSNDLFREFTRDASAMAALTSNVFVSAMQQQGFVNALQTGAIAQALAINMR